MKKKIALALNEFIDMDKNDQQEYLDVLTHYVCARNTERKVTKAAMPVGQERQAA